MGKFRKKPVVISATRWYKQGDHPRVGVVRSGDLAVCEQCGYNIVDHGKISTLEGDLIVCPGDWVITGVEEEVYPCKDRIFRDTYEPLDGNFD